MTHETPDAVTAPGPFFSFNVEPSPPPAFLASIQEPAEVVTTFLPFDQVRHLLTGKPLMRPKTKSERTK